MVICLGRDADLHMAQLMPLTLTISCSSKSRLILPFWYWLTRVVPDNGPLNGCSSSSSIMYIWYVSLNIMIDALNLPHVEKQFRLEWSWEGLLNRLEVLKLFGMSKCCCLITLRRIMLQWKFS